MIRKLVCARLEVRLLGVARALRDPLLAGGAMYALVAGRSALTGGFGGVYRLPTFILIGAATYLPLVWLLNRETWDDLRRLRAVSRG